MKTKFIFNLTILIGLILGSCASSNQVGGGGILQKRKYNKGFYWNRSSNLKNSGEKTSSEFIKEDLEIKDIVEFEHIEESNTNSSELNDEALIVDQAQTESSNSQKEVSFSKSGVLDRTSVSEKNVNPKIQGKETKIESKKNISAPFPAANVPFWVLIVLAILLPPLAVFLFEGASTRFWFDLIFFLVGGGLGLVLLGPIGGFFAILAIIYALLIVCEAI